MVIAPTITAIPIDTYLHGAGAKTAPITAAVVQYDTAATALWLLGIPVPESFWGRPVTSAFGSEKAP